MMGLFSVSVFLVIFATLDCVQVPGEVLNLEQSRAPGHDSLEEAAPETTIQSLPSSSSEKGNSEKSPLVTPSAASLADSVTQGREGRSCECGQDVLQPWELLREESSSGCGIQNMTATPVPVPKHQNWYPGLLVSSLLGLGCWQFTA